MSVSISVNTVAQSYTQSVWLRDRTKKILNIQNQSANPVFVEIDGVATVSSFKIPAGDTYGIDSKCSHISLISTTAASAVNLSLS